LGTKQRKKGRGDQRVEVPYYYPLGLEKTKGREERHPITGKKGKNKRFSERSMGLSVRQKRQ